MKNEVVLGTRLYLQWFGWRPEKVTIVHEHAFIQWGRGSLIPTKVFSPRFCYTTLKKTQKECLGGFNNYGATVTSHLLHTKIAIPQNGCRGTRTNNTQRQTRLIGETVLVSHRESTEAAVQVRWSKANILHILMVSNSETKTFMHTLVPSMRRSSMWW